MNGKNSQWKQKYKCKKCHFCFIESSKKTPPIYGNKIFESWVWEGYSCRQLSDQKKKEEKDILKNIRKYLDENEIFQIDLVFENVKYVMIDGVWISKDICLIIYYEYIQKKVLRFGFYDGERYEYIRDDLKVLRDSFEYEILVFTLDWGKQIKKAIEEIYPDAKQQRCLTHIHRQIQNYISLNPKHPCGKELQTITRFKHLVLKENFIYFFKKWEERWEEYLKEKDIHWAYVHRRLRQARSHIRNALPYMFYFLEDTNVKRSSNDIESYNAVLVDHIYMHRGLKKERLISFISLWIYNRNLK
jgi:transposase-like protein